MSASVRTACRRFVPIWVLGLGLALSAGVASPHAQSDEIERVQEASEVLEAIISAPDAGVPGWILDSAEAIGVFPGVIRGGFGIGVEHGRGVFSIRRPDGTWSQPAFLRITGGSFGFQIGLQATDLVFVVVNRKGIDALVENTFTFGADASVTAGPVGRSAEAETDYKLDAQILSYSRSKGLFAGVSLSGTSVAADRDANERVYEVGYNTRQIVLEDRAGDPPATKVWLNALARHVPK